MNIFEILVAVLWIATIVAVVWTGAIRWRWRRRFVDSERRLAEIAWPEMPDEPLPEPPPAPKTDWHIETPREFRIESGARASRGEQVVWASLSSPEKNGDIECRRWLSDSEIGTARLDMIDHAQRKVLHELIDEYFDWLIEKRAGRGDYQGGG